MRSDRLENQSLHVPLKHFNEEILAISETNRPKLKFSVAVIFQLSTDAVLS